MQDGHRLNTGRKVKLHKRKDNVRMLGRSTSDDL